MLALAPLGAEVIAQRNSHASIVDGLVLSGGVPAFVAPEVDAARGMAHGVAPDVLAHKLAQTPGARAVFVVSPTYYGVCADVGALAQVAHEAGVPLVVDQAWGPHFGFHPRVPPTALKLGADAVLTSTHKIAGSLTQSAMLHVAHESLVDIGRLERAVRIVRSTSPSSLLLISLDASRRQLAVHGHRLLDRTLAATDRARAQLAAIDGVRVVGDELVGTPGVHDIDPLRIVLDVQGTGSSGYAVAAALRETYDVNVELQTHAAVVLVVGMGEDPSALDEIADEVESVVKRLASQPRDDDRDVTYDISSSVTELVVSPRDAFLGEAERVAVQDAPGRISCESIAAYPPGIPGVLPGERITQEIVEDLRHVVDQGARLHGAADPTFKTIRVLKALP
jgi:arginine decarboxylase